MGTKKVKKRNGSFTIIETGKGGKGVTGNVGGKGQTNPQTAPQQPPTDTQPDPAEPNTPNYSELITQMRKTTGHLLGNVNPVEYLADHKPELLYTEHDLTEITPGVYTAEATQTIRTAGGGGRTIGGDTRTVVDTNRRIVATEKTLYQKWGTEETSTQLTITPYPETFTPEQAANWVQLPEEARYGLGDPWERAAAHEIIASGVLPHSVAVELAAHPDVNVRDALAKQMKPQGVGLPEEAQLVLLQSSSPDSTLSATHVAYAEAEGYAQFGEFRTDPETSEERLYGRLYDGESVFIQNSQIRELVAERSSSLKVKEQLLTDPEGGVRGSLAWSRGNPEHVAMQLAHDSEWHVQSNVARNRQTTPDVLAYLAEHGSMPSVRETAKENPNYEKRRKGWFK